MSKLENKIIELSERYPEVSFAKLSRIAVSVYNFTKQEILIWKNKNTLPEVNEEVKCLFGLFSDNSLIETFVGYYNSNYGFIPPPGKEFTHYILMSDYIQFLESLLKE